VHPGEGRTLVERVTTQGERDGCQYELVEPQLAVICQPT
jgi:hypothetical protein